MRNIVLKMTARFLFLIVAGLSFICGCDKAGEEQPVTDSLSSFETAGASDEPVFDSKVKKVIILAGQSNAVGYTAKGHLYESPELFSAERLTAMSEGYDRIQIVFRNNSIPILFALKTALNRLHSDTVFINRHASVRRWGLPSISARYIRKRISTLLNVLPAVPRCTAIGILFLLRAGGCMMNC